MYLYGWPDTGLMRRIKKLDPVARVWNQRLAMTDVYLPVLRTSPDLPEDRLMMITLLVSDLMVSGEQLLAMIDDWMTGSWPPATTGSRTEE